LITIVTSDSVKETDNLVLNALENLAQTAKPTTLVWGINHTKSDVSFGDSLKIISGEGFITENINGNKYVISPNAFFQTNSHAAKLLQDTVLELASTVKSDNVLDLYCGSGFFTIPLAKMFKNVMGIEIVKDAIKDANQNKKLNKSLAKFICGDLNDYNIKRSFDLILVDPPRAGLDKHVLENLQTKAPKNIIYVSCNYKSFAKEMRSLKNTYTIQKSVAIDMFPHTPHVEIVSILRRV